MSTIRGRCKSALPLHIFIQFAAGLDGWTENSGDGGGGSLNVIPHAVVLWFGCLLVGLPADEYIPQK